MSCALRFMRYTLRGDTLSLSRGRGPVVEDKDQEEVAGVGIVISIENVEAAEVRQTIESNNGSITRAE